MTISRDKVELLATAKGMNSTQLAAASGISRQNLSTVKTRGTCNPLTVVKIANALGVNASEILAKEKE